MIKLNVNITEQTLVALQEMVDMSFTMNSMVDRMQSVLDADFAYNNTSNLIHQGIAHKYSGYFADEIADKCLQGYDVSVVYGGTQRMDKRYNSVSSVLYELKDAVVDYQNALNMCYNVAIENMDIHIAIDLIELIKEHNNIVRQMILLCNKIDLYKDNPSFDSHIDEFWILKG